MDINTINNLIKDTENSETTLSNIRNLSALYNVRNILLNNKEETQTETELKDILPSYLGYINIKRKYQLHKTTNDNVIIAMKALCTEIKEFIQTLYSSTDTPQERDIIKEMIKEMP
jgi:hypothetical protein